MIAHNEAHLGNGSCEGGPRAAPVQATAQPEVAGQAGGSRAGGGAWSKQQLNQESTWATAVAREAPAMPQSRPQQSQRSPARLATPASAAAARQVMGSRAARKNACVTMISSAAGRPKHLRRQQEHPQDYCRLCGSQGLHLPPACMMAAPAEGTSPLGARCGPQTGGIMAACHLTHHNKRFLWLHSIARDVDRNERTGCARR